MKPSTKHWYWVAGIYEGEGTCYTNKKGKFRVAISQNGTWLPNKLQTLFGGGVSEIREGHYQWYLYGQAAFKFLEKIRHVLSPRRIHQFEECLSKKSLLHNKNQRRKKLTPFSAEDAYQFISITGATTQVEIRRALSWGRSKTHKVVRALLDQGRVMYTGSVKNSHAKIVAVPESR